MIKATGLGIELSSIKMFIPLLISESCWKVMGKFTYDFNKRMKNEQFKFSARFDFVASIEFFANLSCQIAKAFKLIIPYSRAFERRHNNCLVSSLFGELSQNCGTQFHINQYQKCKDHERTNILIVVGLIQKMF